MAKRRGYTLRKWLTDAGVHRGAGHVFRPPRRPLEPDVVMNDESLRVHPNVFWFGAATMYAVAGSLPLIAMLIDGLVPSLGIPNTLVSAPIVALASAAMLMSVVWLAMARLNVPALPYMNLIVGVGSLLAVGAALASGEHSIDVLPYLLLPALCAAFFMPFKQAAGHLAALSTAILYIALGDEATTTDERTIALNMLFFMSLAVGMLAIARKRIQDGILQNVVLAGRDPLTGVANLRKFNERLQTEIDRSARNGSPLTLLMIDFDDFKLVNDNYSYTLGDAVLVAGARAMNRVVRANELLARRGGDEFAVIAVDTSVREANALAERIRDAVRRERLRLCPDITPEASVGVAQWRTGEQPHDLLRRADAALHVSKMVAHTHDPFTET
ncbi:MAG: GGDEF domain-containing protein [Actinobacteria bacterium]|nr:GGDEF domain-containing protein [Actinomycetota bacterium]